MLTEGKRDYRAVGAERHPLFGWSGHKPRPLPARCACPEADAAPGPRHGRSHAGNRARLFLAVRGRQAEPSTCKPPVLNYEERRGTNKQSPEISAKERWYLAGILPATARGVKRTKERRRRANERYERTDEERAGACPVYFSGMCDCGALSAVAQAPCPDKGVSECEVAAGVTEREKRNGRKHEHERTYLIKLTGFKNKQPHEAGRCTYGRLDAA